MFTIIEEADIAQAYEIAERTVRFQHDRGDFDIVGYTDIVRRGEVLRSLAREIVDAIVRGAPVTGDIGDGEVGAVRIERVVLSK